MSNAQKEAIKKFGIATERWAHRAAVAAMLWMISEMYYDFKTEFKEVKSDVQSLKENDREQFTAIEFLKEQVKPRR